MEQTQPSSTSHTSRKPNDRRKTTMKDITRRRHLAVKQRFDSLNAMRIEGMRLSYTSMLEKLSDEFFYCIQTIESILKT